MTYWVGNTNVQTLDTIPDNSEGLLVDNSSVGHLDADDSDSDHDDEEMSSHHTKETEWSSVSGSQPDYSLDDDRLERKINVISDVLFGLLKKIVAARPEDAMTRTPLDDQIVKALEKYLGSDKTPLEESSESIVVPQIGNKSARDPKSIALSGDIQHQLHSFVEIIAKRHNNNPFVSLLCRWRCSCRLFTYSISEFISSLLTIPTS